MKIVLHRPVEDAGAAPASEPGQGPTLLCSPGSAVDYATRLYPDRRVEVKAAAAEPRLPTGAFPLLAFLTGLRKGGESPYELKRRVVECATRLIGLAKEQGEGVMVGGPVMLRLVGLKLVSIGYTGPFLLAPKPGSRREYHYRP